MKILVLCSCLMPACVPVSACLDFSLNKVFSHRFQWPCKVIHIPSPRCVCVRDSVFTCSLLWYNQFRCQCILIVLLLSPLMIWHFDSFPHSRVWLQNAPSPQFFTRYHLMFYSEKLLIHLFLHQRNPCGKKLSETKAGVRSSGPRQRQEGEIHGHLERQ